MKSKGISMKFKFTIALAITAISFGLFSFTTRSVHAKSTVSIVPAPILLMQVQPELPVDSIQDALNDANAEQRALYYAKLASYAIQFGLSVAANLAYNYVFGSSAMQSTEIPPDALDGTR